MKNAVFWDVTPNEPFKKGRFGGTYRFRHGDKNLGTTLELTSS
jgi:hypothetical protein